MFPALQNLRLERIRQKLQSGHTPAQIAMMFVSNTLTREINNNMPDNLESFVRDLQEKLILSQDEKLDLIVHIANNDNITALDKLCGYIQCKEDNDIIEFISVLEQTQSLIQLGQFLRNVLQRCQAEDTQAYTDPVHGRQQLMFISVVSF